MSVCQAGSCDGDNEGVLIDHLPIPLIPGDQLVYGKHHALYVGKFILKTILNNEMNPCDDLYSEGIDRLVWSESEENSVVEVVPISSWTTTTCIIKKTSIHEFIKECINDTSSSQEAHLMVRFHSQRMRSETQSVILALSMIQQEFPYDLYLLNSETFLYFLLHQNDKTINTDIIKEQIASLSLSQRALSASINCVKTVIMANKIVSSAREILSAVSGLRLLTLLRSLGGVASMGAFVGTTATDLYYRHDDTGTQVSATLGGTGGGVVGSSLALVAAQSASSVGVATTMVGGAAVMFSVGAATAIVGAVSAVALKKSIFSAKNSSDVIQNITHYYCDAPVFEIISSAAVEVVDYDVSFIATHCYNLPITVPVMTTMDGDGKTGNVVDDGWCQVEVDDGWLLLYPSTTSHKTKLRQSFMTPVK